MTDLIAELKARANALHTGERSATAVLCEKAADRLEALEALIVPLAAVGAELLRSEAGEEWKIEIPEDKAIFGFCGATITAGQLRAAARLSQTSAEEAAAWKGDAKHYMRRTHELGERAEAAESALKAVLDALSPLTVSGRPLPSLDTRLFNAVEHAAELIRRQETAGGAE